MELVREMLGWKIDTALSFIAMIIVLPRIVELEQYTQVPHDILLENETKIDLSLNLIPSLGEDEFSQYTLLTVLLLQNNIIRTISKSSFNGTRLKTLNLNNNYLSEFPDLSCLSKLFKLYINNNNISAISVDRLNALQKVKDLQIKENPLNHWPDFTSVGINTCVRKLCSLSISIHNVSTNPALPASFCHIHNVLISDSPLKWIPHIECTAPSVMTSLSFTNCQLGDNTNFANLSLAGALTNVGLKDNAISVFPDFPKSLRASLTMLFLSGNPITSIPRGRIEQLSLDRLYVEDANITSVPDGLLTFSKKIQLNGNNLSDMDEADWHQRMCTVNTTDMEELSLSRCFASLAYLPDLLAPLSVRTSRIKIIVTKVHIYILTIFYAKYAGKDCIFSYVFFCRGKGGERGGGGCIGTCLFQLW